MTLKEAIRRADKLRPNVIAQEQKAGWLYELDGRLAETLGQQPQERAWPEDTVLLAPAPYDNIYELYLCAMIDNAAEETGLYANDMTVFNAAMDEARAWWRRHNMPAGSGGFKLW